MPDPITEPSPSPLPSPAPTPVPTPAPERVVIAYSIVPDFCKMPNGTIVPFDLLASYEDTQNESQNVFANCYGVTKLDSSMLKCTGDEPSVGGVCSGTTGGLVSMLPNSCTVRANGLPVMRKDDVVTMNHGNTLGKLDVIQTKPSKPDENKALKVAIDVGSHIGGIFDDYQKNLAHYQKTIKKLENANKSRSSYRKKQSWKALKKEVYAARRKVPTNPPRNLPIWTGKILRNASHAVNIYAIFESADALIEGDAKKSLEKSAPAAVGIGVGLGLTKLVALAAIAVPASAVVGGTLIIGGAIFLVAAGASDLTEHFIKKHVPDTPVK